MDVDYWGVVHGTRAFLPHLVASGDGDTIKRVSLTSNSVTGSIDYASNLDPHNLAITPDGSRVLREQGSGNQVVVAIFRSLDGESLEDFSIRLAQAWRIGRKDLDNGVIFLVFGRWTPS